MEDRFCLYIGCSNPIPNQKPPTTKWCCEKCRHVQARFNDTIKDFQNNPKKATEKNIIKLSKKHNVTPDFIKKQIAKGQVVEQEHTTNLGVATKIAVDHLNERPDYYDMLDKAEKTPVHVVEKLAGGGAVNGAALSDQQIIQDYPRLTSAKATANYKLTLDILATDEALSSENRKILEQYEGRGGRLDTGKVDESLVHQFYTPYIVCKKMFDLAAHYGFTGGNILEPACGTGRFFKFAPAGSVLTGFDLEQTNIKIATKLYANAALHQQSFETAFLQPPNFNKALKKSWLPEQDLVIGNPPYGDYLGYYKTYMPNIYKRFEFLFIRLGLQLLKPGGLLIYIVSQNLMSNGSLYNKMKADILEIGEFVDAIRLPVGIFTGTAIGTDIVIFRRK